MSEVTASIHGWWIAPQLPAPVYAVAGVLTPTAPLTPAKFFLYEVEPHQNRHSQGLGTRGALEGGAETAQTRQRLALA